MNSIALRRLRLLPVSKGNGLPKKQKLAFLAELGNLGYAVKNPDLLEESSPAFLLDYPQILDTLKENPWGKCGPRPPLFGIP